MLDKKQKIVVVGGGTAGWITLSYLVATVDADFTIIHSDEIDIIGVGESTNTVVAEVARTVGVEQKVWMKDGKATFKYSVDIRNFNGNGSSWKSSFDDAIPAESFKQPLTQNGKRLYDNPLTSIEFYLKHYKKNSELYNRTHGPLEMMMEKRLSPYNKKGEVTLGKYPGHAYHINAFEFGKSLKNHTSKDRYTEINQKIIDVKYCENGVDYLLLESGEKISADLFVDCSGFKRLLIGNMTKWFSYSDLLNNGAVWGQIKEVTSDYPATTAWAQESGWIWEIPTWNQIGSGHVYSDHFSSEERAVDVITDFWKKRGYTWNHFKSVKFNAGRQEHTAIKNVVSNGLSQSFIEPLEATSIMITCNSVIRLAEIINRHPNQIWNDSMSRIFSKSMNNYVDNNKNFVSYHYSLSKRQDTPYWKEVGNKPNAQKEVCDIADALMGVKWYTKDNVTFPRRYNWILMLLGYDHSFINDLPEIDERDMEEYLYYTKMLQSHYEFLIKDNIPIAEYLKMIHT